MRLLLLVLSFMFSLSAHAGFHYPSESQRGLWARLCESLVADHPDDEQMFFEYDPTRLVTEYRDLGGKIFWRWEILKSRGISKDQSQELANWRQLLRYMGNELRRLPEDETRALALHDYWRFEEPASGQKL